MIKYYSAGKKRGKDSFKSFTIALQAPGIKICNSFRLEYYGKKKIISNITYLLIKEINISKYLTGKEFVLKR